MVCSSLIRKHKCDQQASKPLLALLAWPMQLRRHAKHSRPIRSSIPAWLGQHVLPAKSVLPDRHERGTVAIRCSSFLRTAREE